jgi:putative methionine-R-sulfoxide reductase with GAF domain
LTKVIDYTTKYGFGYLMSNGSTGLYYNDDSKMILEPLNGHVAYYEKEVGRGLD